MFLLAFCFLGLFLLYFWYSNSQTNPRNRIKGFKSTCTWPIIGHAFSCSSSRKILEFLDTTSSQYDKFMVELSPFKTHVVTHDVDLVKSILSNTSEISKGMEYRFYEKWLGKGILLGKGDQWRQHRSMLNPAFHFQVLERNMIIMKNKSDVLVERLKTQIGKPSFDVSPMSQHYALDVIYENATGASINALRNPNSPYVKAVKELSRIYLERAFSVTKMFDFLYRFTKDYKLENECLEIIEKFTGELCSHRCEQGNDPASNNRRNRKRPILDIIYREAENIHLPLSSEEFRHDIDTLIFAGHDTIGCALSFTLYLLANHPEIQEEAYQEQVEMFGKSKNPELTISQLHEMRFLDMVIKESLRLYTPVPLIARTMERDTTYGDVCLPSGISSVVIYFRGIHLNPKYYPDPETFNPRRFDTTSVRNPYLFLPFSYGPRNCIGQKFALVELKYTVAKILRYFKLHPANPNPKLILLAETVLKSKNGVPISITKRI